MGLFDNSPLDPANDPLTDVWQATIAEIRARGLEIHGSLSKRNVDEGATAVVLKATETQSGRVAAIKIYKDPNRRTQHRNGDTIAMSNFFVNERRMLAGLQPCPLVPKYYFSVAADDATSGDAIQPFHVMEFIEGTPVTKYVRESLKDDRQAVIGLFRQVLDAIKTIHQFGYLHRDISDGNVLVDRHGNIRLIDLAEASPLGEQHTRLVSTPGFGTEGVATPEQQNIRKIQADDVRDVCTIGYAMFTGQWRQTGETVSDWRRNLSKAGAPSGIATILVKGMTPRDPNRQIDHRVYQSAQEVIQAIDGLQRRERFSKRLIRNAIGLLAIASVLAAFGYFAWDRIQHMTYTSELSRLSKQRETLGNAPREARADARVQERLNRAKELEQRAEQANRGGDAGTAAILLGQAVDQISEASTLAENIAKLRPLVEPLRKILLENDQWNRDCEKISRQLSELGKTYQQIQNEVETGDPNRAWTLIADLQPNLVQLIDDNQKSYEIKELMKQVSAESIGLSPELKKLAAFEQIKADCLRGATHYKNGRWLEARTELHGAMATTKSFLDKHETEEQRKERLASNTQVVNAQLVANESLQSQVKELTKQIVEVKASYQEVLFQGAQYKKERDAAQVELGTKTEELRAAKTSLESKSKELAKTQTERDDLAKWKEEQEPRIADYKTRLEKGSEAWAKQFQELKQTKELLARLSEKPGVDATTTAKQIELAKAEQAIEQFDPSSWDAANERLAKESAKYEDLVLSRKREISTGKTDKHADVRAIDVELETQFRVVIAALKKRDEQDQQAWQALASQLNHQRKLRQTTLDEGWDESSAKIREIDGKIRSISNQQKPHEAGRSRLASGKYDFADWNALKSIPDIKFAASLQAFRDFKLGAKFTNSIGQELVYLPPGTFQMGSPSEESGRDNDESQHAVTLTKDFFLATTENTQRAWRAVMNSQPWKGEVYVREGDNFPAVYISALGNDSADEFCKRLTELERKIGALPDGWEYRLPTEAQWEYACRAGSTTSYHFGNSDEKLGEYAWYDKNALGKVAEWAAYEVATKRANRWGLFDMTGNTWEWTADIYNSYPTGPVNDPLVESGGSFRVRRGGSLDFSSSDCRSAKRNCYSPDVRTFNLGFRVACVQLSSQ